MSIAITNPLGWVISSISGGKFNPSPGTTYFFGGNITNAPTTTANVSNRSYCPKSGVVNRVIIYFVTEGGIAASSEVSTLFLRKNNTTDYTVNTKIKLDTLPVTFSEGANLKIPIQAGDYLEWKWTTPFTWSTAPTFLRIMGWVYLE